MKLQGKLCEVGMLGSGNGRGITIESQGEAIEINGLTEDESRAVAKLLGDFVTVTIEIDKGSCVVGEQCRCGGDTEAVRASCANWKSPNAPVHRREASDATGI